MRSLGFELKSLEVFITTAKAGNMTAASLQLDISQSAVSQILAQLESNLGVKLLDRSVRPVELTVAGRYFYDQSVHLLEQAKKTQHVVTKGSFDSLHLVRIAMVDSLASTVGKPIIDTVKKHTENWTMSTGYSHLHQQGLLSRNLDIIISDDTLENQENLRRHQILKEPFVLVLPKQFHSEHAQSCKSLLALSKRLDMVRYSKQSLIGKSIETYLHQQGLDVPDRMQFDNTFAVLSAVAQGLGWALITPLCLMQGEVFRHQLCCLPLPEKDIFYRYLTLIARRNELGDLPDLLAEGSCTILRQHFLAKIHQHYPWLDGKIRVGKFS
ncbi:LysR family transcriptional regulator [Enterovibrio norvegicus]|uniref:DNA-binding transcriptional regulator, LysR family n=1 Tax=Enterovibrio norvegicus DSM 15893 TaxID=1121869 RepID=A0A1I5XBJ9_9GAMM|nr:LysR family transcriptional regulator [Enterovibrio norvegicus]SFQ29362.1 DNA-binding transcriptional regulator, LysR family [Enterovibrio norvegicus DSM 15893]